MGRSVFRMHVLAAGHGDCLWIEFGRLDSPSRMLVDAGTIGTRQRLEPALRQVRSRKPSHELFVVTHVDADHIGGALRLLENPDTASQFKEVWFNGRRHLLPQGLQPFGSVQGERLTTALLRTPEKWNAAFQHGPVLRPEAGKLQSVRIGGATITVLTPSAQQLANLLPHWDGEIAAAGLRRGAPSRKPRKAIAGWQAFGFPPIERLAAFQVPEDSAPANGSSISLLVEYKKRRILLGADTHPRGLVEGLRRLQNSGRVHLDALKIPHHGSAANVTEDLLATVLPKTVIFSSNGDYFGHPEAAAVARVLREYKPWGVHLVFNYETPFNKRWKSRELQKKWNYTVQYGKEEEGASIFLLQD